MYSEHRFGIRPEVIQPIIFSLRWRENVDDNITKVNEDPACVSVTFTTISSNAFLLQSLADLLPNSFNLAGTGAAANDEIIGERTNLPRIQQNNIISLLV